MLLSYVRAQLYKSTKGVNAHILEIMTIALQKSGNDLGGRVQELGIRKYRRNTGNALVKNSISNITSGIALAEYVIKDSVHLFAGLLIPSSEQS